MTSLDYLFILPLVYFAFQGFKNGIIHEVLSLVGLALAVFFAFFYMEPLAESIGFIFRQDSSYLPFITGSILFIGVLIGVHLVSRTLTTFFKIIHLNFLNRGLGILFGTLKGGIFLSAILLLFAAIDLPGSATRNSSLFYPYIINLAPVTYDIIASAFPGIDEFKNTLEMSIQNQDFINEFFNPKSE